MKTETDGFTAEELAMLRMLDDLSRDFGIPEDRLAEWLDGRREQYYHLVALARFSTAAPN
jgi:hypothetical protein